MGDDNDQIPAQNVPRMQSSDWRSDIDPEARQNVIRKIINTLSSHCTQPERILTTERIARDFEETVFSIASNQEDYLKKISIKMMAVERKARGSAANSSMLCSASGGPNPHQSASRNVQHTVSRATAFEPSSIQASSASIHMHNEGSTVKPCEQSVPNLAQLVDRHQHDSTHQRRFIAPQPKLLSVHGKHGSSSATDQQDEKLLSVVKHQQLTDKKQRIADVHPQTVKQHPMPVNVMRRCNSLGEQQASCGLSSSQGARSHEEVGISLLRVEIKPDSSITSESHNLFRPERVKIESGNAPLEASRKSEASSCGQKHGATEPWREVIYQRITGMKNRYMSKLEEMHRLIGGRLNQLNLQPEHPNRGQLEKIKEMCNMLERMLRLLNVPKEKIVPGLGLDHWEKLIVGYLDRLSKSKNPSTSLKQAHDIQPSPQSMPPQAHSPRVQPMEGDIENKTPRSVQVSQLPKLVQACIPHQMVDSIGLKEKHPTNQVGPAPKTDHPVRTTRKASDIEHSDDCEIVKAKVRVTSSQSFSESRKHLSDKTPSISQSPIQRLVNTMGSISSRALKSSMDDICSVMNMIDSMETPAPERMGSKSALTQDLVGTVGCRLQAKNFSIQVGKKTTLCMNPVPIESWNDPDARNDDAGHKLLKEIKDVNEKLIDTVVGICEEEIKGTIVKCCFNGISLNSRFIKSLPVPAIQPLHLLVPVDYPDCSPVLLDKLPGKIGDEYTDLSYNAMSRLGVFLRGLDDPISLTEMARTWEFYAREVVVEHVERFGGGCFTSRFGTWENCLGAV